MQPIEPIEIDESFKEKVREDMRIRDDESRLEASERNPAIFMREMIGWKPYWWQKHFLTRVGKASRGETDSKAIAVLTSRQIGKSTSLAVVALWACLFNKDAFGGYNTTKVGSFSMSDVQAKKLMYEIKRLMHAGDYHMEEETGASNFFTDLVASNEPNNKTTITFEAYDSDMHGPLLKGAKVGPAIKTYPPTDSVLGETLSTSFIDEAGKVSDSFFEDIFTPTTDAADGLKLYTSTPWQASGWFYEIIKNRENIDVEVMAFDIGALEAEEDHPQAERQLESVKSTIKDFEARGKYDTIQRQYYCEFVQGTSQYFDPNVVDDVFTDSLEQTTDCSDAVDVGIDFGGSSSSHTVITVSKYDEDTERIERVWHKRYDVKKDLSLMDDLKLVRDTFNVQRFIPEECPAGDYYINKMEQLGWNVEPFNPSRKKANVYSSFQTMMLQGRVFSYEDDLLKEEMKALEKEQTRRTTRIHAPRNYNDDMIDSWVLSCYFFVKNETNKTRSLFNKL